MRAEEAGAGGARDLLLSLPLHTLLTLAQTVTHSLVEARTQDDAVKAIILHSPDLESILRRKAITREILFQYLHQKGESVTPATVKQDLIGKILTLWLNENQRYLAPAPETLGDGRTVAAVAPNCLVDTQLHAMAQKFVHWFYPLLKECGLHSDNFWDNTELLLNLQRYDGDVQTITFSGVTQVLGGLAQLVRGYGVVLQPSALGGLSAEMDPHGLVLITICGTVHSQAACTGIYEQSFALTSDPQSQGDWRIKRSKLDVRLESGALPVQGTPRGVALEGSSSASGWAVS